MKGLNILKFVAVVVLVGFQLTEALAQTGVSINSTGTAADADAVLDLTSTDKGVLLPRVADHTTLTPDNNSDYGLVVFDTTTKTYWYWDGLAWQEIPNMGSIGTTLDDAYDGGGSGSGRIIVADAGNVEIQGAGFLTVASNVGIGTTTPDRRMKISGTGWTALEVENTDAQAAALELTSQGVSSYVYTDVTGFLGLESANAEDVVIRTDGGTERMRIQNTSGDVRVINLADAASAVVLSDPQGDLTKTSLTGSATDIFLGTGTFGAASAFEDDDWYEAGTTTAPQAIGDNIYTQGNVAIGANITASSPLQVQATGSGNPANNSILANNPNNSAGNDAIIAARVAGSSAGDPFFSMDISGEAGWSMGADNDHANRFKIAPSWNNLSSSTAVTIKTDGNVGINTDDPDQKLQVNGVMRSEGTYVVDVDGANGAGPRIAWGTAANPYDMMNLGGYNSINNLETTTRDFRIGSNSAFNAIYLQAATGEVGIGTNAPGQALDVIGNTQTSGDFYGDIHVDDTRNNNFPPTTYNNEVAFDFKNRATVGAPGSGTYSGMMTIAPWGDNSGNASHQINFNQGGLFWRQGQPDNATWGTWYQIMTSANSILGSGTANYLARWTPDGTTLGIGTTYDNGTNVGIGTTSPSQKLEVNGNVSVPGSSGFDIFTWAGNDVNWRIGMNSSNAEVGFARGLATSHVQYATFASGAGQGFAVGDNVSGLSSFEVTGSGSGYNAYFRGNVGIGTATPDAHLNVGNAAGATIYLTREDGTTTTNEVLGSLLFDNTDNTVVSSVDAAAGIRGYASQAQGNSNKGGYMTFFTKDNVAYNAAATERMRIHANGTVRIASLDQNANRIVMADANGDLYASASLVGTGLGDNLGNHSATTTLDMNGNNINEAVQINSSGDHLEFMRNRVNDNSYEWAGFYSGGTRQGIILYDGAWSGANNRTDEFGITAENGNLLTLNTSGNHIALMPDGSGNVGVGTVGPSQKLDVAGAVRSTGNHYINNSSPTIYLQDTDHETGMIHMNSHLMYFLSGTGNNSTSWATNGSHWPLTINMQNDDFTFGGRALFMEGNVGIGTTNPTYHLHVSGRVKTTGINETSDVRMKKNIAPISGALEKVLQMDGVTYNWRADEFPSENLTEDLQHGLIAQELEKVIPELVLTDSEGWKSIEYTHLVPVLIEALKEQQEIIEAQNNDINDLKLKADVSASQIEAILERLDGYTNK